MLKSITRRSFFQVLNAASGAGLQMLGTSWPARMPRLSFAPPHQAPRGDVLLVIFLRGAADALNMIVPHGEAEYYRSRPVIGIPRPDDRSAAPAARALDLDGFFGLHPALAPLFPVWEAGHFGVVHACGAPDESRSHFQAMEFMERGVEDRHGPASGWLNRHLASLDTGNHSPLRAVGLGENTQRMLRGAVPVSALRSIADFHLGGDIQAAARMQQALAGLYAGDDALSQVGQETLRVIQAVEGLDPEGYRSRDSRSYPETDLGRALQQVAMLLRAEVGLEAAAIDHGGWDTHFAQGNSEGLMAGLMADLAGGLAAFHDDLVDLVAGLSVVVMTEFGRRVAENASLGTDHGHGGAMLLLGGNVVGGKVLGDWPGLEPEQLFGPGDLAVTTDYRDVLSEICELRLNNPGAEAIFPGYKRKVSGFVR